MSIFDKAGPLGEKIRGQSNDVFKNLENAAPQLEDLAARGTSLLKSIFGLGGGSGESLNYPLDVEGNPAYNATVSFQVVEFRSAIPGKSQKSHLKQVSDNIKSALKSQDATNNVGSGVGGVDDTTSPLSPFGPGTTSGVGGVDDTASELSPFGPGTSSTVGGVNDTTSELSPFGPGATAKKDSKAEAAQLKKISNTTSPLGFFPKQGTPNIRMFFPNGFNFADGVGYQSSPLGIAGAAAESAANAAGGAAAGGGSAEGGLSALGAFATGLMDDAKAAVKVIAEQDLDIGPAGVEAVRFAATRAAARSSTAQPIVSNITKMTVNPNIRTLFNGVNVREFTFQFKMIATSPQEGRVIQDIIKLFRTELYPEAFNVPIGKSNVEAKLGFNFPNAFKIRFNFKGVENQNLPKLKECYLRTMSHTINPTGGGFKVDGKPNEIDMTLSFVENQTLDKDDIKAGF